MSEAGLAVVDASRAEQASLWCVRLAEGCLEPAERAAFDAWLEAHPAHREAFDRAVLTWREVEQVASSPELLPLRVEALESAQTANRRRWTRIVTKAYLPAAAAVAAIAVALVALVVSSGSQSYETGIAERRVVVLSDGSKLSLDAASRVDVRYESARRDLTLKSGRARFEVAKDPLRPFSVRAANRTVVATGTEFSVELVRGEVRVVLYEGRIEVIGGENSAVEKSLAPGQELVAAVDKPLATVADADPVRSLSWESGQLVFIDEPLALAVERVNRYARDAIEIGDPEAARVPVTGVFRAGDTNAFVEGVTAVFPVRLEGGGARRVLLARDRTH